MENWTRRKFFLTTLAGSVAAGARKLFAGIRADDNGARSTPPQRLPGLLPPLDPASALEVSMIHSVAGQLADGQLMRNRPFRDPHHSASLPPW